jgi:FkbM family methyltransferase
MSGKPAGKMQEGMPVKVLSVAEIAAMDRAEAEAAIRARVQTAYLGGERVLVRVLGGPKMFLSTTDLGFSGHVMLDGFWEIWLTQLFARELAAGMTVVDVGANLGYSSILFGEAVGPGGQVVAVEPVPSTADLLARSVEINGHASRTRIARVALGRHPDAVAHIAMPPGEPKNATVVAEPAPGTFAVPSTTLDALLAGMARVDVVKIDAEGAELDIFAGMAATLARHRPTVLLEFNAARYPDPAGFLHALRGTFDAVLALDFDSRLLPVTDDEILGSRLGEDWLLHLSYTPRRDGEP